MPVKIGATVSISNRLKILKQRTEKARYQGTTENSHIVHSTHTAESANVEVKNIYRRK
jgi:hypothetical protein